MTVECLECHIRVGALMSKFAHNLTSGLSGNVFKQMILKIYSFLLYHWTIYLDKSEWPNLFRISHKIDL